MKSESSNKRVFLYIGMFFVFCGIFLVYKIFASQKEINFLLIEAIFAVMFLGLLIIFIHRRQSIQDEILMLLRESNQETQILRKINHDKLSGLKYGKSKN